MSKAVCDHSELSLIYLTVGFGKHWVLNVFFSFLPVDSRFLFCTVFYFFNFFDLVAAVLRLISILTLDWLFLAPWALEMQPVRLCMAGFIGGTQTCYALTYLCGCAIATLSSINSLAVSLQAIISHSRVCFTRTVGGLCHAQIKKWVMRANVCSLLQKCS